MQDSLVGPLISYIISFLEKRWPALNSDRELVALMTGFLFGIIVTWIIYWLVHKGKINGLNATIAGLEAEKRILEKEKGELEKKTKELTRNELQPQPIQGDSSLLNPSKEEQGEFIRALSSIEEEIVQIIYYDQKGYAFAKSLKKILSVGGWQVETIRELSLGEDPSQEKEIVIAVKNTEHIPQGAPLLARFLRQQRIAVRIVKSSEDYHNAVSFTVYVGEI